MILGEIVTMGRAKTYVDPEPFNESATEVSRRLEVRRRTVFNRRRLRGPRSSSGVQWPT